MPKAVIRIITKTGKKRTFQVLPGRGRRIKKIGGTIGSDFRGLGWKDDSWWRAGKDACRRVRTPQIEEFDMVPLNRPARDFHKVAANVSLNGISLLFANGKSSRVMFDQFVDDAAALAM